jgi:hypothetical protein
MKLKILEGKSKSERNKIIAASVLGLVAIVSLGYLFFGDSFSSTPVKPPGTAKASPTPKPPRDTSPQGGIQEPIAELVYNEITPPGVGGGRNIFDIYIPPPPVVKTTPIPIPSPTPTPPLDLRSVSPANVYAKTGDFTIQAMGDKFTPESRISFDNNDLPTKFISPQQLSATVPASLIAMDGARLIMVRTPDGSLYSTTTTINVMAPPMPNYIYVGLNGDKHYKNDIAILRDKNNAKDYFSVKLNDTIKPDNENRFRIVSISEREVVVIDKNLKIRHSLPYTTAAPGSSSGSGIGTGSGDSRFPQTNLRGVPQGEIPGIPSNIPRYQPPQQRASDDDEDDDEKPATPRPAPKKRP